MENKRITTEVLKHKTRDIFKKYAPKLVYAFGSNIDGELGPISDVDIAILWNDDESEKLIKTIKMNSEIQELYPENKIDAGSLNSQNLSFCYQVIRYGVCIYGTEGDRVRYEVALMNEYLDFQYFAEMYNSKFVERIMERRGKYGR